MTTRTFLRRLVLLAAGPSLLVAYLSRKHSRGAAQTGPLIVAVLDPLAKPLSCPCLPGYAQRDYDQLGAYLGGRLGRPVRVVYGESFGKAAYGLQREQIGLVLGLQSVVKSDLQEAGVAASPLCLLTDLEGRTTITGLFVVKAGDPARTISDLQGRTILFGPADSAEKNAKALAALKEAGVPVPATIETRGSCSDAASEVEDSASQTPPAAVVSSYRLPLLEACGEVQRGSLRVIAKTTPVPSVTVFATDAVSAETKQSITAALLAARDDSRLLKAIESKDGFVGLTHLDFAEPRTASRLVVESRFHV